MGTTQQPPHWRGVNHLALITPDMDKTVRFYHGVLGMRLVATLAAGPLRHYFFEIGPENTVAFFEWEGTETYAKPAGVVADRFPMQFDHLSFNVADEGALLALQKRLRDSSVEVTDVVDHGIVRSIYFTDNNGIALEASWWAIDITGRPADYDDTSVFADPHPVAAVEELKREGRVSSTPQTKLVDVPIPDPA